MEDADKRILTVLQSDGRISNQDLAARTGMSTSACWRRVRALEQAGIIRGYAAQIDAVKAGLSFHAIVHVQLARHETHSLDSFITGVLARPEVLDCYATTGEADYHLRVRCRDIDAYNAFLEGFLFRLPGVSHVRTNLVLREIKHGAPIKPA